MSQRERHNFSPALNISSVKIKTNHQDRQSNEPFQIISKYLKTLIHYLNTLSCIQFGPSNLKSQIKQPRSRPLVPRVIGHDESFE